MSHQKYQDKVLIGSSVIYSFDKYLSTYSPGPVHTSHKARTKHSICLQGECGYRTGKWKNVKAKLVQWSLWEG